RSVFAAACSIPLSMASGVPSPCKTFAGQERWRCLGVGKPGITSGRQRINWPQAIETLELRLIYSYQNVLSIWELSRSHDFRDLVPRLTAGVFGFLLLSQ